MNPPRRWIQLGQEPETGPWYQAQKPGLKVQGAEFTGKLEQAVAT